jgi:hypothetical protein
MLGKTLLELKTVMPTKEGRAKEGYILRVVQWQDDDGKPMGGPQLSRQILFLNEKGEVQTGKQKGLTREHWELIKANFEKIDALLGGIHATVPEAH